MKKCLHCGYTWTPRIETEPKSCPYCKSPRWNEMKRNGGRPKRWVVKGVQGNILSRHATEGGAERAAQKYCNEYITDNRLTRDTWSNHGFRVQKIDD